MAEVRRLWIPGPAGRLAAAVRVASPARAAAVIAHPHPLHGGTLDNPVIFHADRELHRAGLTTLRFNFRGVGDSEGAHDEGSGEVDDVGAAVSWLRGVADGVPLITVGYSFGSVCAVRQALRDDTVRAVVAIGFPLRRYPCGDAGSLARPFAVVQAGEDEFGSPEEVRKCLDAMRPRGDLYVVPGTTHLFPGKAPAAADRVVEATHRILKALP